MRSNKDVEAYLLRMEKPWSEAEGSTYVVQLEGGTPLAIKCAAPLVLARVEIGTVPHAKREPLYEHVLRLNASSLVHSAYGLEGDRLLLSAALELENLDYNELEAVVAEFDLAVAQQLPKIRELAGS
ncbi:MAG: CesT family type III secretion system chaperone [Polyangiales bacterium]